MRRIGRPSMRMSPAKACGRWRSHRRTWLISLNMAIGSCGGSEGSFPSTLANRNCPQRSRRCSKKSFSRHDLAYRLAEIEIEPLAAGDFHAVMVEAKQME